MKKRFSSMFSIRYTSLMILASASLLFVGCSTDSDEMLKSNNALCIDVTFDDAMTRAAEPVNGGSFSGSASLGVSLYKEDKSDLYGSATSNVSYTTTDGLSWSSSSIISLNANLGVVTAYYPYTADVDITAIPMKTSDPKDWMYQPFSEASYSATSSHADIALKHAQAVIKVIINKSSANPYTGAGNISDITISSSAFSTEGTLNSTTGEISGSTSTIIESSWNKVVKANGNTGAQDQWFVAPIAESTDAKVSVCVKIDEVYYNVSDIPVKTNGTVSPIKQGNIYTFTFNLSSTALTIGNVSIADWADGGVLSGDLAPFDPFNGHAYVDLGLPSGTLWATCNLGADNPEDYGDYFAWAETTPKEEFLWTNYVPDYLSCPMENICESEYDAASYNWGDSWQLPTHEDFVELTNYCEHQAETINDVPGLKFVGMNGNTLFLPAAGYKSGYEESDSDIIFSAGSASLLDHTECFYLKQKGFYWAGTITEYITDYFYMFQLNDTRAGDIHNTSDVRYQGFSVRPIVKK